MVNSAKAAVDKADAAVKDAEAQVARREGASLKNPGLIPGEELETYKTKRLTAKADRDVATQALRTAELNLRDSSVCAPIEGVVQTRTIETGQYVPAGYVMATLLRSEPLLLRFQVEPRDAPRIKPGVTATFTMRETQRQYSAKITLISAAADATTHMVPVTGEVNDEGHKYWLRPGSFCDVAIDLSAQREAPIIPRSAARATDHGYIAYVIEGDVAKEHGLTLGMSTKDGWVEVRSGLAAGDLLVVRGAEALSEGAKVRATKVTADTLNKGGDADAKAPPAPDGSGEAADASPRRKRGAPSASASAGAAP
jgi:membrane fusion protein, multidrug efflux system